MDFKTYQREAAGFAIYPIVTVSKEPKPFVYPMIGLAGEVGEIAEKLKKNMRDFTPIDKVALTKELGDILWYVSELSRSLDIDLDDVATTNIAKLTDRLRREVLGGSGDNR